MTRVTSGIWSSETAGGSAGYGLISTAPFVFSYDADDTTVRLYIGGGGTATSGRVDTLTRQ